MIARRVLLFVAPFAAALLVGCAASRVTLENYERVKEGMSMQDVEQILGKPDKNRGGGFSFGDVDASGSNAMWKSGDKRINITFVGGKVLVKAQTGL